MAAETAPMMMGMAASANDELAHLEDTPAYKTLKEAGILVTKYRKQCFEDIFDGVDLSANSSKSNNLMQKCIYGYYVCPIVGCILYKSTHTEFFVPAGHVGLLMNEKQEYLFAQPGMHNISGCFMKHCGTHKLPTNNALVHGNRCILMVEQGFLGLAFDNGQPVLLPPGIHVWTSDTLSYNKAISLDQHMVSLGPYTLITVDEGYAAVTQNNGKQHILPGGATHLLNHKNWRFEKFLTLKIQTDDLEQIKATSADNITMQVTSTVTWCIKNPTLAATMGAETMAVGSKAVSSDITKLRQDVLKQAIASLASFIGGVNYSDSFHMAASVQGNQGKKQRVPGGDEPESEDKTSKTMDNPLYDVDRMNDAVAHANVTAMTYGVEILSINILSAVPIDVELTKALACGAVASAQALQAETAARGNAKAMKLDATAAADKARIEAEGLAQAEVIRAKATAESARLVAEGNKDAANMLSTNAVAVDLARMDKSAQLIGKSDKFFFGQEPSYLSSLVLKGEHASKGAKGGGLFG
jgi:regulator of protease activity HflC (stomatin/prohibitin superfamily)